MHGFGGHDPGLEEYQCIQGHGLSLWIIFDIKFQKCENENKRGQWVCFGAPAETFRYCEGAQGHRSLFKHMKPKVRISCFITVYRISVRVSAVASACMDLYEGSEEHEDHWWNDLRYKMGRVGLVVTVLLTKDPNSQSRNETDAIQRALSAV